MIEYKNGIFFQKEQTFAPTDIGTGGYYVTGNNVLIYKLDSLEHERGLGGKQIEIEFADIQELLHTHSSTIAEFADKSS